MKKPFYIVHIDGQYAHYGSRVKAEKIAKHFLEKQGEMRTFYVMKLVTVIAPTKHPIVTKRISK